MIRNRHYSRRSRIRYRGATDGSNARQQIITTKYAKCADHNKVADYKPVMRSRHPAGTRTPEKRVQKGCTMDGNTQSCQDHGHDKTPRGISPLPIPWLYLKTNCKLC